MKPGGQVQHKPRILLGVDTEFEAVEPALLIFNIHGRHVITCDVAETTDLYRIICKQDKFFLVFFKLFIRIIRLKENVARKKLAIYEKFFLKVVMRLFIA